jgi:hypothetical protein
MTTRSDTEITLIEHVPDRRGKMRREPRFFKPQSAATRAELRQIADAAVFGAG